MELINVSERELTVPGHGRALPGKGLQLPEQVARHLLLTKDWRERQAEPAAKPAKRSAPEAKEEDHGA